jgi:hypothetical protein
MDARGGGRAWLHLATGEVGMKEMPTWWLGPVVVTHVELGRRGGTLGGLLRNER